YAISSIRALLYSALFLCLLIPRPPPSTLFPYTTLFRSSRSATDLAIETSPDIILMDLSLPSPGGIETTQRIKRELPSTGIIVLAASEDAGALFDAIKAGSAALILKDLRPDDLVTLTRRA